jgi:hypothetical protein
MAPVTQGDTVTGVQGTGVGTPSAALVAATKAGLAGEMHMPKGMMFTNGTKSLMLAAGWLLVSIRWMGSTTRVLVPGMEKSHNKVAPLQT